MDIKNVKKIRDENEKLIIKLAKFEMYVSCINHKTGLPKQILDILCNILTSESNKLLEKINADFRLKIVHKKEILISLIGTYLGKGKKKEQEISINMSSGYQKFVIDLIIRIIVMKTVNTKNPRILMIDEGFGCLDDINFMEVCKTFIPSQKEHFDSIIIISHITELNTYFSNHINIKRQRNSSAVKYPDDLDSEERYAKKAKKINRTFDYEGK